MYVSLNKLEQALSRSSYKVISSLSAWQPVIYIDDESVEAYDYLAKITLGEEGANHLERRTLDDGKFLPFVGELQLQEGGEYILKTRQMTRSEASILYQSKLAVDILEIYNICYWVDMVVTLVGPAYEIILAALSLTGVPLLVISGLFGFASAVLDKFTDEWSWFKFITGATDRDFVAFLTSEKEILWGEEVPYETMFLLHHGVGALARKPSLYII